VGHLLICFSESGLLASLSPLLPSLSVKFQAASSPSVIKSYALAVSYFIVLAQDNESQMQVFSLPVLDKWTTFQGVFEGTFARNLTYTGLLKIFSLCVEHSKQLGQTQVSKSSFGPKSNNPHI